MELIDGMFKQVIIMDIRGYGILAWWGGEGEKEVYGKLKLDDDSVLNGAFHAVDASICSSEGMWAGTEVEK